MKYYLDITLLPDSEINLAFLWQKIYQQIHIALADNKIGANESAIAVSFPRYGDKSFPLGDQMRLFTENEEQLKVLNINKWLNRFMDYVHIKSIKLVPEKVTYACYIRQQMKGEAAIEKKMQAKAKHWSEKSGLPIEECLKSLEKSKPNALSKLPFIWLESQETKRLDGIVSRKFPLFIKKVDLKKAQAGYVNCYGLNSNHKDISKLVSVPQF